MAAAVRNFRIWGYVLTPAPVVTITINGDEVFNGAIDVSPLSPPTDPLTAVPMIYGSYNGDDWERQILKVEIKALTGTSAFGNMQVDHKGNPPWVTVPHFDPSSTGPLDLGRANILINGVPPEWPTFGPPFPGGTPENPDWVGWTFRISEGDVLTFDYLAESFNVP